jgi:hypothetical protein
MLLAKNFETMMINNQTRAAGTALTEAEVMWGKALVKVKKVEGQWMYVNRNQKVSENALKKAGISLDEKEVMSKDLLNMSYKSLLASQIAQKMVMFGAMLLTQKLAKDNWVLAGVIGAVAGAYMGWAVAQEALNGARLSGKMGGIDGGLSFYKSVAAGALAGAAFNILMQQMLKPSMGEMPGGDLTTMDMGGRFLKSRAYDMGGRYSQEHGMAILKEGETVNSKTGNMLNGGITLNMGDVHVQDGEDFAERVAEALPMALRRVNETGGI